jgi:hypothetical protein
VGRIVLGAERGGERRYRPSPWDLTHRQLSVSDALLDRMDIAQALAVIDRLWSAPLPRQHARTDTGTAGPGWEVAELETSEDFWEDCSRREEAREQVECDREALAARLAERWGPPQTFGLYSVLERTMEGEELAEPWASLSGHVVDLTVWRHEEAGRWTGLGISQWDAELPFQLLAVVTDQDPP